MMRSVCVGVLAWALLWGGCDGDDPADAGPGDDAGAAPVDAGPGELDAGPADDDAGPSDGGAPDCNVSGCPADETCLRGVCVPHCGADPSGWDAAIAARLTPVAGFCRAAAAFGARETASGLAMLDLTLTADGSDTRADVSAWVADPGVAVSTTALGSATLPGVTSPPIPSIFPADSFMAGYFPVNPSATHLAFGYTTSEMGFPGEVFVASAAGVDSLSLPGNFGGVWLDDTRLLLAGLDDGTGAEAQTVFVVDVAVAPLTARVLITGFAPSSGSLGLTPDSLVVGDTDFPAFGAYTFPRAMVATAATSASTLTVADGQAIAFTGAAVSAFTVIGAELVSSAFDGSFAFAGFEGRVLDESATPPTAAAPTPWTTTDAFIGVQAAGSGRAVLQFTEGYLLVEVD